MGQQGAPGKGESCRVPARRERLYLDPSKFEEQVTGREPLRSRP